MSDEQPAADALRVSTQGALSSEQKTGFVLLLVFAILGLSLGVLQIRNTLLGPFALNNSVPSTIKDQVNDVDALRYRDTDNDGLSDYDELYTYSTSPYLYDSFGYGMSDKEVVSRGLARCAGAGKNCADESTPLGPTSTLAVSTSTEVAPPDLNQVIQDPKQLRSLLIQNGMSKDILDKVSDADLLALVAQMTASSTVVTSTR